MFFTQEYYKNLSLNEPSLFALGLSLLLWGTVAWSLIHWVRRRNSPLLNRLACVATFALLLMPADFLRTYYLHMMGSHIVLWIANPSGIGGELVVIFFVGRTATATRSKLRRHANRLRPAESRATVLVMNHFETMGTGQKALRINIDAKTHGTFAEIGAGQEVARWFFRVGGAAGTIAKTISAYDKTVSDAIYGPSDRYVSRHRLQQMLDYEYKLLIERLDSSRGAETTFFVFANTVAARSYSRRDDSHGWLGLKFQTQPRTDPSQIMIHVRLLDDENVRQQEALGAIGVNLIHGAFFERDQVKLFIKSLLDQLSRSRIEVDMIEFSGPGFNGIDNRLISLQLVEQGLTEAVMFTVDGQVVQPSEVLYKKPVLVERGTFRPVNCLHVDLLKCARQQFLSETGRSGDEIELMEITMRNLLDSNQEVEPADFLARVDTLRTLSTMVLVTSHGEFYHTVEYLRRSTKSAVGFAIGLPTLEQILDEKYYENLSGGILEALGRIFEGAVKFYVYPTRGNAPDSIVTTKDIPVPPSIGHLVAHLRENGLVEDLLDANPEYLNIHSSELLAAIQTGNQAWEAQVPASVAEIIKSRRYFGYKAP